MACNLRNPTNIENSSIQNTRLIGYFTKVSMQLFELSMFDLVKNNNCRRISGHQREVCYILFEIADNHYTECI